jgi:hypothetical protein
MATSRRSFLKTVPLLAAALPSITDEVPGVTSPHDKLEAALDAFKRAVSEIDPTTEQEWYWVIDEDDDRLRLFAFNPKRAK